MGFLDAPGDFLPTPCHRASRLAGCTCRRRSNGSGMPARQDGCKPGNVGPGSSENGSGIDATRSGRVPSGSRRIGRRHGGVSPKRWSRARRGPNRSDGETPPAGGSEVVRSTPRGVGPDPGEHPKEGTCRGRTGTSPHRRVWERAGAGQVPHQVPEDDPDRGIRGRSGAEVRATPARAGPKRQEPPTGGSTPGDRVDPRPRGVDR